MSQLRSETPLADVNFDIPAKRRPRHIAVIMDGNGRWAQKRNQPRIAGHRAGAKAVRDIIVECAPARVFAEVAGPAIEQGRILMPLSVGALLDHMDLVERGRATGARIIVPTGALIGLDTVRAMAEGEITRVVLGTRTPPGGLAGAPHLVENDIDIANLTAPLRVFHGSAREAARGFPANVNVAAALALAGIGAERTEVEVWADPTIDRNIQSVTITSDSGEATMTMRNIPSAGNPRTGRIVANSVLATLRRLTATLTAGS